jgi:hypothetical protein
MGLDQEMEGRGGSKDRRFGVSRRGRQGSQRSQSFILFFAFRLLDKDPEICWTLESDANWLDTI